MSGANQLEASSRFRPQSQYSSLPLVYGLCNVSVMQAAERYLRSSGLQYTIVRPGGLSNDPPSAKGNLFVSGEDTLFGLESDPGRAISRDTVRFGLLSLLVAVTKFIASVAHSYSQTLLVYM